MTRTSHPFSHDSLDQQAARELARVRNEEWHREHPALRAENERRAAEREAIYREQFGLPNMSRIEAAKHVELMRKRAA